MASLYPVYEKIKDFPESEIQMEDVAKPIETKEDCCESQASSASDCCKKDRKATFGRRLCACACGFVMFGFILWVIAGVAFASYLGVKAYRCIHPRHQALTSFTFDDNEVKEFDLGVVSGVINVHTCPKASKIMLVVARRASQLELVDTMPIEKHMNNGIFKLNVMAPSFDFHHCQSAYVELIIPDRLHDKVHLSIKAQTLLGKIVMNAPKHKFDKVELLSDLGFVKTEHVTAQNLLEAEARVGHVSATAISAKHVALTSTVGSVCASVVQAEQADVSVETGRASLGFFNAPVASIKSNLGWVSAWGWAVVKSLDARVAYGRLNFSPGVMWRGKFTVESPYGWIDASHHRDTKAPVIRQKTPAVIAGAYDVNADADSAAQPVSELNLMSTFGAVNFFIPAPMLDEQHKKL